LLESTTNILSFAHQHGDGFDLATVPTDDDATAAGLRALLADTTVDDFSTRSLYQCPWCKQLKKSHTCPWHRVLPEWMEAMKKDLPEGVNMEDYIHPDSANDTDDDESPVSTRANAQSKEGKKQEGATYRGSYADDTADDGTPLTTKPNAQSKEGKKQKGRGSYKCGRCGAPKKGHVCQLAPFPLVNMEELWKALPPEWYQKIQPPGDNHPASQQSPATQEPPTSRVPSENPEPRAHDEESSSAQQFSLLASLPSSSVTDEVGEDATDENSDNGSERLRKRKK
jgi:hypothetical protein